MSEALAIETAITSRIVKLKFPPFATFTTQVQFGIFQMHFRRYRSAHARGLDSCEEAHFMRRVLKLECRLKVRVSFNCFETWEHKMAVMDLAWKIERNEHFD